MFAWRAFGSIAAAGRMGQLNEIILAFDAIAKGSDGNESPFHLEVSAPEFDEGRGIYCKVRCPYLREAPFLIFGADEQQARELVTDFIGRMLEGRATLVDDDGNKVEVPIVGTKTVIP